MEDYAKHTEWALQQTKEKCLGLRVTALHAAVEAQLEAQVVRAENERTMGLLAGDPRFEAVKAEAPRARTVTAATLAKAPRCSISRRLRRLGRQGGRPASCA